MSSTLSPEQKKTVATWVSEGASLSEIQKRITADFEISMTYMDVRFLVDDLDLVLKDKEPESPPKQNQPAQLDAAEAQPGQPAPEAVGGEIPPPAGGKVTIAVDPIQRPGVALGGTVTFSDGQKGQWQLDQYGQLGFVPPAAGYQPSPADVREFQTLLQQELAKLGY